MTDFDVVIVGAGMGGSATAYALRNAGLRVLILERGAYVKQEHDNWNPDAVISEGRYDPTETWTDSQGDLFRPRVYYNVGGSSKFFGGVALRLREDDFNARSYPQGVTPPWPITYDELAPYYEEAERCMWVHGLAGADPTDPPRGPFPGPPIAHEPAIGWIAARLAATGITPLPLPMAINQGSDGTCQKGSPCDGFPCKIRAKGDGENAFLRPALRAKGEGSLEIRTEALVVRFAHDAEGRSVSAVEYQDTDGRHTVTSRVFVLAAGAANSAALLLRSASSQFPAGLANTSGQVGRNFMAHNNTVLMAFSPFRRNRTRFQKTLGFNDFYRDTGRGASRGAAPGATGPGPAGHVQMRGKVVKQNLKKSTNPVVRLLAGFIAARSFDFWVMSEDLPDAENRVELATESQMHDSLTVPGIRLTRRLNNLGPHRALVREMKERLRSIGLPIVLEREPSPRTIQHQCGTLRFGSDPAKSVCDVNSRAHDLDNLYVADGSVFPSSAAVNPALTIAANALRVGGIIVKQLAAK